MRGLQGSQENIATWKDTEKEVYFLTLMTLTSLEDILHEAKSFYETQMEQSYFSSFVINSFPIENAIAFSHFSSRVHLSESNS